MKKILIIPFLLTIYIGAFAQGGFIKPNNSYGTIWNRGNFDSTIYLPTGCGAASLRGYDLHKAAEYFDSCGSILYIYNPAAKTWSTVVGDTTGLKRKSDSTALSGYTTLYQNSLKQDKLSNTLQTTTTNGNTTTLAIITRAGLTVGPIGNSNALFLGFDGLTGTTTWQNSSAKQVTIGAKKADSTYRIEFPGSIHIPTTSFITMPLSVNGYKADSLSGNISLPAATENDPIVRAINGIIKSDGTTISAAGDADIRIAFGSQPTTYFLAGPTGVSGTPIWRSMIAGDVPNLVESQITGLTTDLASVVHLAGTETISGQKDFTSSVGIGSLITTPTSTLDIGVTGAAASERIVTYQPYGVYWKITPGFSSNGVAMFSGNYNSGVMPGFAIDGNPLQLNFSGGGNVSIKKAGTSIGFDVGSRSNFDSTLTLLMVNDAVGDFVTRNSSTGLITRRTATETLSDINGVSTTTTVAGHPLSSNVSISASDLTTGALLNGITATTQAITDSSNLLATTAQIKRDSIHANHFYRGEKIDTSNITQSFIGTDHVALFPAPTKDSVLFRPTNDTYDVTREIRYDTTSGIFSIGAIAESKITNLSSDLALKSTVTNPQFISTSITSPNLFSIGTASNASKVTVDSSGNVIMPNSAKLTTQNIAIASGGGVSGVGTGVNIVLQSRGFSSAGNTILMGIGTNTNSTGLVTDVLINPTWNQTSTAAGTDLGINRIETATGSGEQLLINAMVNSTSRWKVNSYGIRVPRILTTASGAAITINSDTTDMYTVTALATGVTFANPTGHPLDGQTFRLRVKDNATAQTIAFGTNFRGSTSLALPTTTTISKTMYMQFIYNAADAKWDLLTLNNGF